MQILRLLAARRAPSNIATASSKRWEAGEDDEGPFFDLLDFSSCSVRASSSGSSVSDSDSDESCAELDFIISMQRSHSASPLKFCASEPPPARANSSLQSQQHGARKRGVGTLRSLSFGARKAEPLYVGGRHSFARSSFSSTGSLRLFMDSPPRATADDKHHATAQTCRRAPSRDVIRQCLAKISRRLRTEARSVRRLRKCRSAPPRPISPTDDSAVEKQDGIAGAIAHCKESLHRDSPRAVTFEERAAGEM